MELLELGKKATDHALKLGVDEAEAFLYVENQASVKLVGGIFASRGGAVKGLKGAFARIAEPWIKKKGIPIITSGIKAGVGIRAIVNKAIGFASVSSIEEKKVLETVEEATRIAKIRPPDPNWILLPEAGKPLEQGGVFDKRISDLDIQRMLDLCVDGCVAAGDFDKRITQALGMISVGSASFAVVNSKGIELEDKGTFFMVSIGAKGKSGTEEVASGDILFSRTLVEDLRPLALAAAKKTVENFGKKALKEKHVGTVVFENVSWNQLLMVILNPGISALNIQENRSVLRDKLGKQVARENVSIIDDGTMPNGFGTSKMDDEGVPKQKTTIVEKGFLSSYLYDNYCARREARESTGNASRRRLYGPAAYFNQPIIRPSNLVLAPGKGDLESLVGDVKNGVLVKGELIGAGHSNVVTGDFSITADNAFKIENGAVAYPLKPCTVAGNLYECLNSVVAIGNDSKCIENAITPSVVIEKIVVST